MWLTILSDQLPVVGLVGRYLTNYLMGRDPLPAPHKLPCVFPLRKMPLKDPRPYYKAFRPIIRNVGTG